MYLGYNQANGGGRVVSAEPSFGWVIESDYDDGAKHSIEGYWEYQRSASASGASNIRPIFVQINRATGAMSFELNCTAGFSFNTTDGNQTKWGQLNSTGLAITPFAGQSASLVLNWVTGGQNFIQIGNSSNGLILQPVGAASATWEFRIGAAQAVAFTSSGMTLNGGLTVAGHLLQVTAVDGVAIRVQDAAAGYSYFRGKRAADTTYRVHGVSFR
jgi:hypothetical protein